MLEWEVLIANTGFPIAITIYILVRMEKAVDKLRTTIDKSTSVNNETLKLIVELKEELIRRRIK